MDIFYLTSDGIDGEVIHLYEDGVHRLRREVQSAAGRVEKGMGKAVPPRELGELRALLEGIALCPLVQDDAIVHGDWCELRIRDGQSLASYLWFQLPAAWRPLVAVIDWLERHAPSTPRIEPGLEEQ